MAKAAQNPCTGKTVVSAFAAIMEAKGIKLHDVGNMEIMGVDGQAQYNLTATRIGKELHDSSPVDEHEKAAIEDHGNKLNVNIIQKVLIDQRHPSGVLGEDFVKPVLDFSRNFHATHWKNLSAARKEYTKGMRKVLDSLDTSGFNLTQKGYFAEWSNELMAGGDLYPKSNGKTGLGDMVGNFVENSIHSSWHVLGGHFISSSLKLASLYPDTALPAILKTVSKNPFRELPELAELGLYGRKSLEEHPQSGIMKKWDGLVKYIDTPVANAFYFAGEARGGTEEGLKAAQVGAFKFRINDTPRQLWTPESRTQVRFLNWTINSSRLYASLWANPFMRGKTTTQRAASLASLTAFHVLPFMIGGAAAASQGKDFVWGGVDASIPGPLRAAIGMVDPELGDSLEQNKTGMSELLAIRDITGIGIATDAFNQQEFVKVPKALHDASKYFHSGDPGAGFLELGSAGLHLSQAAKLPGPLGIINDGNTVKTYDIIKKQIEGTNTEEFGEEMMHFIFPWSK